MSWLNSAEASELLTPTTAQFARDLLGDHHINTLNEGISGGLNSQSNVGLDDGVSNLNGFIDHNFISDNGFGNNGFGDLSSTDISQFTIIDHPVHGQLSTYDFQDQDHDVVLTGWSPHLPDPATARHLYVEIPPVIAN